MTNANISDRDKTICDRYQAGETTTAIAETVDLSAVGVRAVLVRHGIERRHGYSNPGPRPSRQRVVTTDEEAAIIAAYKGGASLRDIGAEHRIGTKALARVLDAHGLSRRLRGAALDERDVKMGQQYEAGESAAEIAAAYDCAPVTVFTALARQGIAVRNPNPKAGTPTRFTAEQEADLVARYQKGENPSVLAREHGCSHGPIKRILIKHGVYDSGRSRRGAKYTAEERAEMVERYNAGEAVHPLAEAFDTVPQSMHKILVGLGVTMRTKGGKYPGVPVRSTDKKTGYVKVLVDEDDPIGMAMAWANGYVFEHRLVMAHHLGRSLKGAENVHHVRTDGKGDNRLENLELWTTSQPKGQRVADKIEWALEFLAEYGETPTVDVVGAVLGRLADQWLAQNDPGDL